MKETLLDVLLYLFENYFYDDPDAVRDRDSLQASLIQAGFSPAEVNKAFDWLDGLDQLRTPLPVDVRNTGPLRLYAAQEQARFDLQSRGFLLFLEQNAILDGNLREQVIDRAMALDQDELDLDDLKWVVLMVLFNQPGHEAAFAWMESHMFALDGEALH
ncbi:DUF494 family protein [Aquimonas sp.]|jgi:Smg protein|uniref:DUF494 family protein n=1 Tax=Aquimonas sp. TaxID=1872588 RepID=UPI0037BE6208